jgi:hypothetical protein
MVKLFLSWKILHDLPGLMSSFRALKSSRYPQGFFDARQTLGHLVFAKSQTGFQLFEKNLSGKGLARYLI